MRLLEFMRPQWLIADLRSDDKTGVLAEMVAPLVDAGVVSDASQAVQVLLDREKLGSTGIGEGIAIPHGKLPRLENVVAVFARSKEGVDFEAMDGAPVHLFFLLMAPENSASLHLKALARISRMLRSRAGFRDELMNATDVDHLYQLIEQEDEKD